MNEITIRFGSKFAVWLDESLVANLQLLTNLDKNHFFLN